MKIRIYHELNGTVRIVKVVEQGPEKGKESSMFHNLKPGSMAEVEIDAVLQHQACMKESKSESKEKDDSCNLQKFLQVYAPDMPYILVLIYISYKRLIGTYFTVPFLYEVSTPMRCSRSYGRVTLLLLIDNFGIRFFFMRLI